MSISHSIELRTKAGALSHVFPPSSAAPPPPPASAKYAIHPVTGSVLPLPHDGLTHAYYSPTGRYLVGFTGSSIVVRDTESGDDDAVPISFPFGGKIRADKSAASGGAVGCVRNASCYDSGSNWPTLVQFSKDERVAMRIGTKNELHFYLLGGGAEAPTAVRVRIKDVSFAVLDAESSPSGASVLTFVAGNRNVPARASLFSGIVLEGAAGVLTPPPPPSSKSQIADEASLSFSRSGRSGLALMSTSVDRTGASYYGSTFAILLNAKGAETVAPPKAEGPVHALRWHPTREEFVVCAGAQPSCSALYDATGCQTYSFGTSHRNTVCFSPHSNLLALGGFGNLAGGVSVFHLGEKSVVTQTADFKTESPAVSHGWSPCGLYFLCATTSPRHVMDNGYTVYDHMGKVAHTFSTDCLYAAHWAHDIAERTTPAVALPKTSVSGASGGLFAATNASAKYVPPSARGRSSAGFAARLRAEHSGSGPGKVSKASAEAAAHRARGGVAGAVLAAGSAPVVPLSKSAAKRARAKAKKEEQKSAASASAAASPATKDGPEAPPAPPPAPPPAMDPEKVARKINKQLKQIEGLKSKDVSSLNDDQVKKLASEAALRAQLAALGL